MKRESETGGGTSTVAFPPNVLKNEFLFWYQSLSFFLSFLKEKKEFKSTRISPSH
jgi:hypothetical protein